MTSVKNEGIKSRIVVGDKSQMIRWMRRRRRRRKMAEKLLDVVVTEQTSELPPSYEDSQATEVKNVMNEMKSKTEADKKDVREMLKQAGQVKENEGESLYRGLFGMLMKDCVDSILKKEVMYLTTEMCRFRNNIAQKMIEDESRADAPMNLARMPEGFAEAWKLWRAGDTEDVRDARGEKSYQALVTALSSE